MTGLFDGVSRAIAEIASERLHEEESTGKKLLSQAREDTRLLTPTQSDCEEAERKCRHDLELGIDRIRKQNEIPYSKSPQNDSSKTNAHDTPEIRGTVQVCAEARDQRLRAKAPLRYFAGKYSSVPHEETGHRSVCSRVKIEVRASRAELKAQRLWDRIADTVEMLRECKDAVLDRFDPGLPPSVRA